jgi:ABC-type Fe3+-hydroxamate transport system substrate-binding protein
VVACTGYCADVEPALADGSRAILADSWTANTAQIVAVKPDLVIASVPYQAKAVSEILKAGAAGVGDRGAGLIAAMQQSILRRRTAASARPRVWCEEWGSL